MAIDQGTRDKIYELRHVKKRPWAPIYKLFPGIPKSTLRWIASEERRMRPSDARDDAPPAPPPTASTTHKVEFTTDGREATAYSQSQRIKTLEQLLEAADVDLNEWHMDHGLVGQFSAPATLFANGDGGGN